MAETDLNGLARRMDDLVKVVEKNAVRAVQGAARATSRVVVFGTRVKTGRARGNWTANVGAARFTTARANADPDGTATLAKVDAGIAAFRINQVGRPLVLANGVPYIGELDKKDGFSTRGVEAALAFLRTFRFLGGF